MTFPNTPYGTIGVFADDYFENLVGATKSLDRSELAKAAEVLQSAYKAGRYVFACGNGGSAAISNHLNCDLLKGVQTDTNLKP